MGHTGARNPHYFRAAFKVSFPVSQTVPTASLEIEGDAQPRSEMKYRRARAPWSVFIAAMCKACRKKLLATHFFIWVTQGRLKFGYRRKRFSAQVFSLKTPGWYD